MENYRPRLGFVGFHPDAEAEWRCAIENAHLFQDSGIVSTKRKRLAIMAGFQLLAVHQGRIADGIHLVRTLIVGHLIKVVGSDRSRIGNPFILGFPKLKTALGFLYL